MLPIQELLPRLSIPRLLGTVARFPVWRDSTTAPVKFVPVQRTERAELVALARAWDRETRLRGLHGGIIGRTALVVFETLLWRFLNVRTGRLDPSKKAIAEATGFCERTVCTALAHLKNLGVINWLRRCEAYNGDDGRFILRQRSNAYAPMSASQWRGYQPRERRDQIPDGIGSPAKILEPLEAAAEAALSGDRRELKRQLDLDPVDPLARALARFAAHFDNPSGPATSAV